MNFLVDPPELTSARIYSGPGSGQMFSAAQAWDGLAAELRLAASSFESVTANLVAGAWQGASATAMAAVATPMRDCCRAWRARSNRPPPRPGSGKRL